MAVSAEQLQADITLIGSVAEEMITTAGELGKLAQETFPATFEELSRAWQGDTASLFTTKATTVMEEMLESAKNLQETAVALVETAKSYAEAEIAAMQK